jgi:hypothetical protein
MYKSTEDKELSMRPARCVGFVALSASVLLGGAVCSGDGEMPQAPGVPNKYELADVSFLLERGFCHGECPIYSVEVLGNGTVFFIGERHVRVEGQASGFVSHEQVLELLSAFFDAGFPDLRGMYLSKPEPHVDDDGRVSMVHIVTKGPPRTVLTLRIGDYSKQVNYQAKYAPRELRELALFMDELVNSKQWIVEDTEGHD